MESFGDILREKARGRSPKEIYEELKGTNPALAREFLDGFIARLGQGEEREALKAQQLERDGMGPGTLGECHRLALLKDMWTDEEAVAISRLPAETRTVFRLAGFQPHPRHPSLQRALDAVVGWLGGRHTFVTLAGPPGVGKTHLLVGVGWELVGRKALVQYWTDSDLHSAFRRAVGEGRTDALLEDLAALPYLILDDLGIAAASEWTRATLDQLVDRRWLGRKALLVATNLKAVDLPQRLVSRLRDTALGLVVQIDALDYRIHRGKA